MKFPKRSFRMLAMAMMSLAAAPMASASDGVLEINQTCALQTGCFSGDSPGYPVTIGASGAYQLTSNLRTSDSGDVAVRINVNDVDLDLNGFGISCSFFTPPFNVNPCSSSPNSSGNGVEAGSPVTNVRVRNGTVRNMAADGLSLHDAHVESVAARGNGQRGIDLSGRGIIENSVASTNGGDGMKGSGAVNFVGNSAQANSGDGIVGGRGSAITHNVSVGNALSGISATYSVVSQNSVTDNGNNGIQTTGGSIQDNIVHSNGEVGLFLDSFTGYRGNTVSLNVLLPVIGGINLGGNSCNFAICP